MNEYIDHTLLKPEASTEQIKTLCEEANKYNFKSVCVNAGHISLCRELLKDSDTLVCTVVGFPLGATTSDTKAYETKEAISNGADEIDMVINIGALKEGLDDVVKEDIQKVVKAAEGKIVKVIFETCLLNEEEISRACELAIESGAHFIKTSTGFSSGGATKEAVTLMLKKAAGRALVKASGGIRSYEDASAYIEMGVKRLGTSSGVKIMAGEVSNESY